MSVIEDGRTGKTAEVDEFNRLRAFATVESDATAASLAGNTFYITHPLLTLTSDSQVDIIYVENTDSVSWVVNSLDLTVGNTTGGSGTARTTFKSNATGGSLITDGEEAVVVNMNLGSSKPLNGIFKYNNTLLLSADAPTILPSLSLGELQSGSFQGGPIAVPPGTNFTMGYTPPLGNTSIEVEYAIIVHREGVG